jgi:hypothetical protein
MNLANVTQLARKRHLVPNRSLLVGVVYRATISQISLFFDAIIYIGVGFVQCVKLLVSSCLVLCCDVRYDVCFVFAPNLFYRGSLVLFVHSVLIYVYLCPRRFPNLMMFVQFSNNTMAAVE